ncbi:jg8925 [Pararge aegeria aegeria]|uniref:Jg8925 protein n=1 Tax=Pararge aegeria aegeria TaxID=348720 RepID=A0A8S4SDY8_9NEOP|nr:jg8925 [Pararge aegeria aegeria]
MLLGGRNKHGGSTKSSTTISHLHQIICDLFSSSSSSYKSIISPLQGTGPPVMRRGITDSSLCRACVEADETPSHVMLRRNRVAEQRSTELGSPPSLPEALGDQGGLQSLAWELYQWHYVQQKVPADLVRRQAQDEK